MHFSLRSSLTKNDEEENMFTIRITPLEFNELSTALSSVYRLREYDRKKWERNSTRQRNREPKPMFSLDDKVIQENGSELLLEFSEYEFVELKNALLRLYKSREKQREKHRKTYPNSISIGPTNPEFSLDDKIV